MSSFIFAYKEKPEKLKPSPSSSHEASPSSSPPSTPTKYLIKQEPIPNGSLLLVSTSNTQDRDPIFDYPFKGWQVFSNLFDVLARAAQILALRAFIQLVLPQQSWLVYVNIACLTHIVTYASKTLLPSLNAGRLFNFLIRAAQVAREVNKDWTLLTSVERLRQTYTDIACLTHMTFLKEQNDEHARPKIIDMLVDTPDYAKHFCEKTAYKVDENGKALVYIGPYPKLYALLVTKIMQALSKDNIVYHYPNALGSAFTGWFNRWWMGMSPKSMIKQCYSTCFNDGWKSAKPEPSLSLYCLQPALLASIFALKIIVQLDETQRKTSSLEAPNQGLPKAVGLDWKTIRRDYLATLSSAERINDLKTALTSIPNYFPITSGVLDFYKPLKGFFKTVDWVQTPKHVVRPNPEIITALTFSKG